MEIWKDIECFENVYQVSNTGKVMRLQTKITRRNQYGSFEIIIPECLMKLHQDSKGYPQVSLNSGGSRRVARVHRLVAEAFLEPPSEELVLECRAGGLNYVLVNHKDSNPTNNNVSNLEWCSPRHNILHRIEVGNGGYDKIAGSRNFNAILTENDVKEILKLLESNSASQQDIAELFGVNQITISNINTGRSWNRITGKVKPEVKRSKRKGERLSEQVIKETH